LPLCSDIPALVLWPCLLLCIVAVKCNPEPLMLGMLAALGAGFDCASVMELQAVQDLGVDQERVIFANPCKMPADFRWGSCAFRGAIMIQNLEDGRYCIVSTLIACSKV
jgi:hypothetical protein